jgi:hypothetical protein
MADSSVFLTVEAMRLREKVRSASALSTFLPRMIAATRLSFCGLMRSVRATACASLSCQPAFGFCLAHGYFLFAFLSAPWP